MGRLIAWLWRWLARIVEGHYDCHLVDRAHWRKVTVESDAINLFCARSGFLRDGRYSGGRHAERKLRRMATEVAFQARKGTVGPWRV